MLIDSINGNKWKKDIIKKISSFADKCPLLVSITTGTYKGADGVFIECNRSGNKYFFRWIYDQDQKEFVHDIKTKILKEYPRIVQVTYEEHEASAMEIAKQLEKGVELKDTKRVIRTSTGSKLWRIDKVLPWRQVFILDLEAVFDADGKNVDFAPEQRKYQYNSSAVIYLKDYRTGKFKTPIEAGDAFFNKSSLITTLKNKESKEN
jgi:hypothetical protein